MSMPRIEAFEFGATDSATAGIQEAIDALPESGGTVVLPAGTFRLRRSVRLKSRVTLRGEGAATVLTRPPEFTAPLAQDVSAHETRAVLAEVGGLAVGDEIAIHDDEAGGWHMRHGIIRSIAAARATTPGPAWHTASGAITSAGTTRAMACISASTWPTP